MDLRTLDGCPEAHEKALAEGLREVAAELRLVDALDFIGYCRAGQHAVLNDIVNSSVELFFKDGTLRYGWAADIDLTWQSAPCVMLDMEFQHQQVCVFFSLALQAATAAVSIRHMELGSFAGCVESGARHLASAIADAQLPNPPGSKRPVRLRSSGFRLPPVLAQRPS